VAGEQGIIRRVIDGVADSHQPEHRNQHPIGIYHRRHRETECAEQQTGGKHESRVDAIDQEAGRRLQQRRGDVEGGDRQRNLGVADAERVLHLAQDRRQQHAVHVAHEVRHGDQGDDLGVAARPGLGGRQGATPDEGRLTRRRH
jgi:hypothetical protein